jgi:hypothetical protein
MLRELEVATAASGPSLRVVRNITREVLRYSRGPSESSS